MVQSGYNLLASTDFLTGVSAGSPWFTPNDVTFSSTDYSITDIQAFKRAIISPTVRQIQVAFNINPTNAVISMTKNGVNFFPINNSDVVNGFVNMTIFVEEDTKLNFISSLDLLAGNAIVAG